MPLNEAAWVDAEKSCPHQVREAPLREPTNGHVRVSNAAIALNPVDGAIQKNSLFPRTYPAILVMDLAGVIDAVESNVTHVKPGDRVLGLATSLASDDNANGAFQKYTLVRSDCVAKIPDSLSFEQAAVLPLALATAALGLFGETELNLRRPSLEQLDNAETVLIWGGLTGVGGVAIQLARLAGYKVVATASPRNHKYVVGLGAEQVFDYHSTSVVRDVLKDLKDEKLAGVFEASGVDGAMNSSAQIVLGATNRSSSSVACVRAPPKDVPLGVAMKPFLSTDIIRSMLATEIFTDLVPRALQQGKLRAVPQAKVVGTGLESIQAGIDLLEKGVSATKLVIKLE
ncbi:zinc-binding oxidoreductase [Colletotrichum musicola]|uniref:Zinc-binding oxidoreductase n=1 Tax=Colletotrichum musicola TaxID=2175873 RepID=A0A8H6KP75_9PEZI|nr:zinc-binding oxidoreductase [Colletotrichum musicola]